MILYPKCRRRSFTVSAVQQLGFIKIGRAKVLLYLQASWSLAPAFHIFTPIWLKFDTGDLYLNTSSNCEFHESGRNENSTSLTDVIDFHIYCPVPWKWAQWKQYFTYGRDWLPHIRELHVMFLGIWELSKYRLRKAVFLLRALVKIHLHVRYTVKSLGILKVKHVCVKLTYCIME
jgi:hypothetical protein